jgi:hypothetical protein
MCSEGLAYLARRAYHRHGRGCRVSHVLCAGWTAVRR